MARLRKKLGHDGKRIVTVYGRGFRLDVPDDESLVGRRALLEQVDEGVPPPPELVEVARNAARGPIRGERRANDL